MEEITKSLDIWKILTVITLVLLIANLYLTYNVLGITGKFLETEEPEEESQPTQPTQQPVQQQSQEPQIDWSVFQRALPNELKSKILAFNYQQPVQIENNIQEFKDFEACENTVIVFYAEGCGWCKNFYPILAEAKEDFDSITFYTLELSKSGDIAQKYRVTGTPSTVINCKYLKVGYMAKETLYPLLDKYVK